jgi:hypothetical protein
MGSMDLRISERNSHGEEYIIYAKAKARGS